MSQSNQWLAVATLLACAMLLVTPAAAQTVPSGSPLPLDASPSLGASPSPTPTLSGPIESVSPWNDPQVSLAWQPLTATEPPPAREDHTLTVDGDGGAWLYGGRDGGRIHRDLWRLDLATAGWTRVTPVGSRPTARFGHNAAWVEGVGVVVFGGQTRDGFLNDLWAYRPDTNDWDELPASGPAPRPRYGSCAALGPDGRLWISHGFTADGRFDDSRAYDFATGRWANRSAMDERPVARCLHECLWSSDGRFLLYGGQTNGVTALGDLWAFQPAGRTWELQQDQPMPARRLYAAAELGGAAWIHGGLGADDERLGDTWRLDLGSLASSPAVVEQGDAPAARSGASLITDPDRGRLLLFGGEVGQGDLADRVADLWALAPVP